MFFHWSISFILFYEWKLKVRHYLQLLYVRIKFRTYIWKRRYLHLIKCLDRGAIRSNPIKILSNPIKILWYHRLPIILSDFSKLLMIWIIFVRFQCDFMRFQVLFVKIPDQRLNYRLTRLYVIFWFLMIAFLIPTEAIQWFH